MQLAPRPSQKVMTKSVLGFCTNGLLANEANKGTYDIETNQIHHSHRPIYSKLSPVTDATTKTPNRTILMPNLLYLHFFLC